jgi:hypothetical protein
MAIAGTIGIVISELDYTDLLPITGSCEMDIDGDITPLFGSQMCISSGDGSINHYRIVAIRNTNFNIMVNQRLPENGDGFTFTPIGKITSDINDFTIVPGQNFVASTGELGIIDIKFGGQIIISNAFSPNSPHEVVIPEMIVWQELP